MTTSAEAVLINKLMMCDDAVYQAMIQGAFPLKKRRS